MADLCGPSNALQNFQKHTSVDRTLQQDRLVGRHTPSQGFRSISGPGAGTIDHEFEAFQAGHTVPTQPIHHLPHLAAQPPLQFAQASQAPDWATDFQKLNIHPSRSPQVHQHLVQAPNVALSWHQDFMSQQTPAVQPQPFSQHGLMGMTGPAMLGSTGFMSQPSGFGLMHSNAISEVAQGKQRVEESIPQFDEAAFERAFADAHQDMLEEAAAEHAILQEETQVKTSKQADTEDPAMLRTKEERPGITLSAFAANRIRTCIELGQSSEASQFFGILEKMESMGKLTDPSEAKSIVETLEKAANREAPQDVKIRCDHLIRAINERLMSTYPLHALPGRINQDRIWEDQAVQQQPQQKEEEQRQNDDEMAETAGRLLERVADNTSDKFQNSQFLELMRRLRDREVRVEGDKMVEIGASSSSSQDQSQSTPATIIPEIDPHILDHAATDFSMPIFDGEEHMYTPAPRQPSHEHVTDEVSGQYSYYNIHATYHKDTTRIPIYEQDLDLGRDGAQGLSRNGLNLPVEEYIHHHWGAGQP